MTYTRTAIALHWLTALLIATAFGVGYYMADLPLSPMKLKIYSWHKWLGMTVLLLALARLAWRAGHPAPPLPDTMQGWEKSVAGATHILIYLLMLAAPLAGWLMSSAAGFKVVYLGVLPLPDLIGKDKELAEFLKELHFYLTSGLGVLVLGHIAAALKHHLIDRDQVLARMMPSLLKEKS
ncbi:MAG: cytochrome b [Sulfuricella sp.]|nr:cytochrome b [Sulfuricella sp.]